MKRLFVVAAVLVLVGGHSVLPVSAGYGVCDPQQSLLCNGLFEWWNFEESYPGIKLGSYRSTILDQFGADITIATSDCRFGSRCIQLSGTGYLAIPRYGDIGSYATVSVWVYQTTRAGTQYIVASQSNQETYSGSGHWNSSGFVFYLLDGKPALYSYNAEDDSTVSAVAASAISLNTWTMLTFKLSPYGPYGKSQGCWAVNNGGFTCTDMSYNHRASTGDLMVGYAFLGKMDGLGIWTRAFSPFDREQAHRNGSPLAFPFY